MEAKRKTVFIKVGLSKWKGVGEGWVALFSQTRKLNDKIQIATGSSVTHASKGEAWGSIADRVGRIDFDKTDVYFNGRKVSDATAVQSVLAEL